MQSQPSRPSRAARGFTLLELLVVVSMIAVVVTMSFVLIAGVRSRQRDARRLSDMSQVRKAMDLFFAQYLSYPDDNHPFSNGCYEDGSLEECLGLEPYLQSVSSMRDPVAGGGEECDFNKPAPCDYFFRTLSSDYYELNFYLENKRSPSDPTNLYVLTPEGIRSRTK